MQGLKGRGGRPQHHGHPLLVLLVHHCSGRSRLFDHLLLVLGPVWVLVDRPR